MKKLPALMLAAATMIMSGCNGNNNQSAQIMSNISEETVGRTVQAIVEKCPQADRALVQKGVAQAAALWRAEDGTEAEFGQFAAGSYAATPEDRKVLFDKLSAAFEAVRGVRDPLRHLKPGGRKAPGAPAAGRPRAHGDRLHPRSVQPLFAPVGRPLRQQDGICHHPQFPLLHP